MIKLMNMTIKHLFISEAIEYSTRSISVANKFLIISISLQFEMAQSFDDFGNLVTADYRVCKRYLIVSINA